MIMNINNIKVYIIAIALIFSVKTQNVGAHGALYELKQIDEKK